VVQAALERGLPVIWLMPGDKEARLLSPDLRHRRDGLRAALQDPLGASSPCTAIGLASLLKPAFAPADESLAEREARRDYVAHDPLASSLLSWILDRTVWRSFAWFKRTFGRIRRFPPLIPLANPPPVQPSGPAFGLIDAAFAEADARANQLGAIHRSQQLWLSVLAPLAVLVGVLPVMVIDHDPENAHLTAAAVELALAGFTLMITLNASRARRHRRWSDARRLAERLRSARAIWPLDVELGDNELRPAQSWTEWRARAVLRQAGPPQGVFGPSEFAARRSWAIQELVDSQINYHAREHHAAEWLEGTLEAIKTTAFATLVLCLTAFLIFSIASGSLGAVPPIVPPLVLIVSSVSPAVGAAALAMEFTNGFAELGVRSRRLAQGFLRFKDELDAPEGAGLHESQEILRNAAILLVEDADSWRDRVEHRRIAAAG
jgi:hypothetical protein